MSSEGWEKERQQAADAQATRAEQWLRDVGNALEHAEKALQHLQLPHEVGRWKPAADGTVMSLAIAVQCLHGELAAAKHDVQLTIDYAESLGPAEKGDT